MYAKYCVVVEEHFYDFKSTELESKQIIETLAEDFYSHDEEQTFMTSTIKVNTIFSNKEKSSIVSGVCNQRKENNRALLRPRILTTFPRLFSWRPLHYRAFGLLQVQSVLPA